MKIKLLSFALHIFGIIILTLCYDLYHNFFYQIAIIIIGDISIIIGALIGNEN